MTTSPVLAVAACALLLVLLAAWLLQPRPVQVAGEAGFKWLLGQVLRARAGDWRETAASVLPFHPLGRFAERKIVEPRERGVLDTPLPGEVALVEQLAGLPDAGARWDVLRGVVVPWIEDEGALDAGSHPSRWLGPQWRSQLGAEGVLRRLGARLVVVAGRSLGGAPDLGAGLRDVVHTAKVSLGPEGWCALEVFRRALGLVAEVPSLTDDLGALGARALTVLHQSHAEGLAAEIEKIAPDPTRLVILVTGDAGPLVLRVLVGDVPLRDRVVAVAGVGAAFGGWPGRAGPLSEAACADWNDAWFRHEHLDVEVVRRVPYAAVVWMDPSQSPPGVGGLPAASQRLPKPRFVGAGGFLQPMEPAVVEVLDLGVLDPRHPPPVDALRDALVIWVGIAALAGGA